VVLSCQGWLGWRGDGRRKGDGRRQCSTQSARTSLSAHNDSRAPKLHDSHRHDHGARPRAAVRTRRRRRRYARAITRRRCILRLPPRPPRAREPLSGPQDTHARRRSVVHWPTQGAREGRLEDGRLGTLCAAVYRLGRVAGRQCTHEVRDKGPSCAGHPHDQRWIRYVPSSPHPWSPNPPVQVHHPRRSLAASRNTCAPLPPSPRPPPSLPSSLPTSTPSHPSTRSS
jgi:hypothetical protein